MSGRALVLAGGRRAVAPSGRVGVVSAAKCVQCGCGTNCDCVLPCTVFDSFTGTGNPFGPPPIGMLGAGTFYIPLPTSGPECQDVLVSQDVYAFTSTYVSCSPVKWVKWTTFSRGVAIREIDNAGHEIGPPHIYGGLNEGTLCTDTQGFVLVGDKVYMHTAKLPVGGSIFLNWITQTYYYTDCCRGDVPPECCTFDDVKAWYDEHETP